MTPKRERGICEIINREKEVNKKENLQRKNLNTSIKKIDKMNMNKYTIPGKSDIGSRGGVGGNIY